MISLYDIKVNKFASTSSLIYNPRMPTPYEKKFASLLKAIADSKAQGVDTLMVFEPQALGDDYQELLESLNRIAAAELHLAILPPKLRTKPRKG